MKDLQVTLNINHAQFTDKDGVVHAYVAYKFELGGQTFYVSVKDKDKSLLNYILRNEGFFD